MPPDFRRLPALPASETFVFSKLEYLRDLHLWPLRSRLDPFSWIKNFTESERPYAVNILNVFLYFTDDLVDAMFRASVHSLCSGLTSHATSLAEAKAIWSRFLRSLLVTYVQSEQPSLTDSGIFFARKARQVLGIPEEQIVDPASALEKLLDEPSTPIMFVDDFVGSGNQIIATWRRQYAITAGSHSFAQLPNDSHVIYVPVITTRSGLDAVNAECTGLRVRPTHCIDDEYSLVAPTSVLWPDRLRSTAPDVLYTASVRAGIVDNYEYGWKGFHDLGLALAFEHSVPDATLPLIFWDQNDWRPLLRRT